MVGNRFDFDEAAAAVNGYQVGSDLVGSASMIDAIGTLRHHSRLSCPGFGGENLQEARQHLSPDPKIGSRSHTRDGLSSHHGG